MIGLSTFLSAEFTRSGNVVIDSKTDLEWQDDYSNNGDKVKSAKWIDAIDYCEELTLDGKNDWRLPNKKELLSIVDYTTVDPAISSVFEKTKSFNYWSSTNRYDAFSVHFGSGFTTHISKEYPYYVRCVRFSFPS